MVYCTKCGEELPEDAFFCPKCGQRTIKGEEAGAPIPRYSRPYRTRGPLRYKVEDVKSYGGKLSTDKVFFQVGNIRGPVRVSTWDKPEYSLELRIEARGYTEREAVDNLEKLQIELEEEVVHDQTRFILKYDYPWDDSRWYSIEVDVILPRDAEVDLDVGSSHGGIYLTNLKGDTIEVGTSHGNLVLDDISAESITGKTSHGGIEGKIESKDASLATSHGKIYLTKFQGDTLMVKTSHGNIVLDDASAKSITGRTSHGGIKGRVDSRDASLSTSFGKIDLTLPSTVSGNYKFHTSRGTIELNLSREPQVGYDLDLHTSRGRIEIDLPDLEYMRTRRTSMMTRTKGFDSKDTQIFIEASTSGANIKINS